MNPRVEAVKPLTDHLLEIRFTDGQVRHFDMRPYLDTGVFSELRDPAIFNTAQVTLGTVTWANGADLCPDTLFLGSTKAQRKAG
jgi:hypothetical protein